MTRIDKAIDISGSYTKASSFWIVFGLLIAGFFIGQFVSSLFLFAFAYSSGVGSEILERPELIYESITQSQLLISQAFYTFVFTFFTPWFYLKVIANKKIGVLHRPTKSVALPVVLTLLATVAFMAVNAFLVEWNANIDLPDGALEDAFKQMEEDLATLTERFTKFDNFGSFLLGFVVIAVLPGIGEEFMFRGVLQNSLHKYAGNKHVAIWLTAFLFAAIHLQFYGLVPRMMLGVLFGYLYVWSGNLWLPIISHIANNGIAVTMAYYAQVSETDINIDDPESLPLWVGIVALVLCLGLLFLFRNHYLRSNSSNEPLASSLPDHHGTPGTDH